MISNEERDALRLWFAAFEPAVDVEVTEEEVFVWSTRPNRTAEIVRCGRTTDIYQDLNSGLSQLVERMSYNLRHVHEAAKALRRERAGGQSE